MLLQASTALAKHHGVLYVTGEESLQQLALRAQRLQLPMDNLSVAAETRAEVIANLVQTQRPKIVILDSIQVMQVESVDSTPGSVGSGPRNRIVFTRLAKQQDIVIVLVGHITKEGGIVGPKVLEHMIDCFMMLDSPAGSRYRTLRGHKNRFGAVNELGIFAMTDLGMKEVANPSAIFLQRGDVDSPGSIATVTGRYPSTVGRATGPSGRRGGRTSQARCRWSRSAAFWPCTRGSSSTLWYRAERSRCVRQRCWRRSHYRNRSGSRLAVGCAGFVSRSCALA